ncbi:MAG: sigma 54-interacting transcriptional regulator [Pyrinomonadaceae bacterium]
MSRERHLTSMSGGVSSRAGAALSPQQIDAVFLKVGQNLRDGKSNAAEALLTKTINSYTHKPDDLASLKRLLSFTLETTGRYRDSLDALSEYETAESRAELSPQTEILVRKQLGIALSNAGDQPKAITLLKDTRETAEDVELSPLAGSVDIALARVYRKLSEYPISRDYAERSLNYFRNNGDWLGMAEAYREIANSLHQEGHSDKAIEYFELGIKIIGNNSAPFMLGKLYTDMSGAYWFLRRPQDGIECLEKSIAFFDKTEHVLNSVIAYNNLGINLTLIGDWGKAEEMIRRALELAEKQENNAHVIGILDSLAELMILRGDNDEAEKLLERSIAIAKEVKRPFYEIQALRNLARLYLAQNRHDAAIKKANETIEFAAELGDKHFTAIARLILAEGYLQKGDVEKCVEELERIEKGAPTSDFFVLGNIQRIRGLTALAEKDGELAVHHFSRGLTIFEAASDLYHTGMMHFLIGVNLAADRMQAKKNLNSAGEIFSQLGLKSNLDATRREIERLDALSDVAQPVRRANSVVSQLLTVRLAEATASRELLFRELVAVLKQESNAKKIVIAQYNEENRLYPFIAHGCTPHESNEIATKFDEAATDKQEKAFARSKDIGFFHLRGSAAPSAVLLIAPQSGAVLADESSLQPLLRVVELGMDVIALRERDRSLPDGGEVNTHVSNSLMPGFIHSSPAMTALVEEVYKIRSSDVTVLITGESGTGKELVARAVHTISNRKDKVFVPFNCTAVPKELAEGHLFGHKKGAFTGAVNDSPGMIRTADGGTLFLDEVGDLSLDVQPKLLRFLQEGEVQTLGEKHPIKVDVRIIAATNMKLEEKVADGSFREDLYYRLNVIRLRVPPLRERRSEIPPIVNYYINHYSARFNKQNVTFMTQTIDMLMVCNWEGNVRQLCNEVQRVIARAEDNEVITPEHLSPDLNRMTDGVVPLVGRGSSTPKTKTILSFDTPMTPFANMSEGGTLEEAVSELEMRLIRAALTRHNWNISRVAAELGLTRRGLYLKLARYGIEKAA